MYIFPSELRLVTPGECFFAEIFQRKCLYTTVHVHTCLHVQCKLRVSFGGGISSLNPPLPRMFRMYIHVHCSSGGRALTASVRGPRFNPGWLPVFHTSLKIFPSLSSCTSTYIVHCGTHINVVAPTSKKERNLEYCVLPSFPPGKEEKVKDSEPSQLVLLCCLALFIVSPLFSHVHVLR